MTSRLPTALLAATAVAMAAHTAAGRGGVAQLAAYAAIALLATAALAVAVVRRPRGERLPWALLAAGTASSTVGDLLHYGWPLVTGHGLPDPSPAAPLFFVAYPLMAAGCSALVRAARPRGSRAAAIDATIITVGVGVVTWAFLVRPHLDVVGADLADRALAAAHPVGSLLLVAMAARLALTGRRGNRALVLLTTSVLLRLVAHGLHGALVLRGSWVDGGGLDLLWIASYGCLGAAALHAGAAALTRPLPLARPRLSRRRLALLAAASLLAPAVGLLDVDRGIDVVPTAASAALFLLVILRMAGLLRIVERSGERRFEALVRQSTDLVVVLDDEGVVRFASPSIRELTGVDPTGNGTDGTLPSVHADDLPALADQLRHVRSGVAAAPVQARVRHHDGRWRHVEVVATDLRADPDVGGVVLAARDTTERVHLEEELRHQAFHDPLTGLPNRALLLDRIGHALARTPRTGDPVALIFCDLDDFKAVNDSLGHTAGDDLLLAVARRLEACVRPGDTAARLGGDEFAVLLDGVSGTDHAVEVATRILDRLRAPLDLGGTLVAGVASVGVAVALDGHGASELLRDADIAMYESKSLGKGRVTLYEPAMHAVALQRLRLKADLRGALAEGQHRVEFQPIVELRTGRPVAVEALARWDHPAFGAIPPERFVPLAEESGAIHELGAWVLRAACAEVADWDRRSPLRVDLAVNLSPLQLEDPGLVDTIAGACRDAGLDPRRLVLELTEGELVDHLDGSRDVLDAIRRLGVRIAIDDFGTGSSSLAYLHRLPVDAIKIDKTFIDHLDGVSAHATLTRGIVELTKALGVTTIAEGIESPRQVVELIGLGCARGQGFHFARPLGGSEVLDLLTAWALRPALGSPTAPRVA